jgi:tRNA(His) guanylyltransferase
MTNTAAELELKGTLASDKNEILFQCFQINYNDEPAVFRKGTVIYRDYSSNDESGPTELEGGNFHQKPPKTLPNPRSKSQREKERKRKLKATICLEHVDLVGDEFWRQRPWILAADARGAAIELIEGEDAE